MEKGSKSTTDRQAMMCKAMGLCKGRYVQGTMGCMGNRTEEAGWGWIAKHLVQLTEDIEYTLRIPGCLGGI